MHEPCEMPSRPILTVLRDASSDVQDMRRVDPAGFALGMRNWKVWNVNKKEKASAALAAEKRKLLFTGPGCLKRKRSVKIKDTRKIQFSQATLIYCDDTKPVALELHNSQKAREVGHNLMTNHPEVGSSDLPFF